MRWMAAVLGGALATALIADLALCSTPLWFFQPWTGPLARQNLKLYCALKRGGAADVVVLGDSRARHAFVPGAIAEELAGAGDYEVMNLALDAAQIMALHEIARRLFDLEPPPRVVVIGVSEFDLNAHNPRLARDLRLYARPMMMLDGLIHCPDPGQKLGAVHGLLHGLEVSFQLIDRREGTRTCGFLDAGKGGAFLYPLTRLTVAHNRRAIPYTGEASRRKAFEREVEEYRSRMMRDFEVGKLNDRLLRDTLDLIAKGGSRALVALMPESLEFTNATSCKAKEEARIYLGPVCRDHGAVLVDLNDDNYRPPDRGFFDYAAHLEPEAAIELSRKLARNDILRLLLSGKSVEPGTGNVNR